MSDEYVKYLYTDRNYKLLDVRGKKTPADAQAEGDRLASILKEPVGVFRLEHIAGAEYAAQHCIHRTAQPPRRISWSRVSLTLSNLRRR